MKLFAVLAMVGISTQIKVDEFLVQVDQKMNEMQNAGMH